MDTPYDLARTNTGALVNAATYQSAVVSEGFSFNGTGGHVRVPDQASFHCTTGLTIEAWVHPTNVTVQNEIVDKWDAVVGFNQRSYAAALLPGGQFFLQLAPLGTAVGATYVATTNAVALNGWTHVAGTYDGSLIRVYLNGVLNAQGAYTNGIFPGTNDLAIGGVVGGAAYGSVILPFKGWIDEPSIYNRALSSTEITALYSAGSTGKCKVDTDGDGLTDLQEAFLGTNPNNQDTDGDYMDDGWEWDHFGSFSRGGSGDYHSDNVSDRDEYTAGSDPNTITFETHYPNLYVSNRTVTGSCAVASGVPAQMTVLVNSTNWPAAVWSPYNSNFSATLPNQDSNHIVLVALRGRARDATAVWDETEITLDRVPPVLVVTNPATPTVSKPYLQLQGYANEALATLTYDLTKAFGLVTNELVAVVDQFFDTNRFDFTTNYFQGYDLALAPSSNRITLRVTDLAGNVATTNLTVALDYAAATSPVLEVVWPTNGTHLAGDSFYVRGNISDETASVVAESVAANGVTNVVSGLVERNRVFWVEGLPLAVGTNEVRLIATSAAGKLSSTQLSVVKSGVLLTIDSTPAGESLYEPFGVVSGTVSYPNYTVTVNGQAATVDAEGHWTAGAVPVVGRGTATFDAVTTLAGGGGGSAPPVATSVAPELPAMIVVMKHFSKYTSRCSYAGCNGTEVRIKDYTAQFAPGADGQWRRSYQATVSSDVTADGWSSHNDYRWSHTSTVGTQHSVSGGVEVTAPMDGTFNNDVLIKYVPDKSLDHEEWTTGHNAPIRYLVTHFRAAGVKHRWENSEGGFVEETLKARTDLKLFTNGKVGIGRRNLLCLNVWAEELGRPVIHPWTYTYGTVVAADRIQLLGRSPGADGNLWLALPDNTEHSLNLRVPSAEHINAEAHPQKYKLKIKANGADLSPTSVASDARFCVGGKVTFAPAWDQIPAGIQENLSSFKWSLEGNYVNFSSQPCSTCSVNWAKSPFLLTNETTSAWWTSGGYPDPGAFYSAELEARLTFSNGQTAEVSAEGCFNMFRPKVNGFSYHDPAVKIRHTEPGAGFLETYPYAEFIAFVLSSFDGAVGVTQLANGYCTNLTVARNTVGEYFLDNHEFVRDQTFPVNAGTFIGDQFSFYDGPLVALSGDRPVIHWDFENYIRFKPNGDGNIYVTLDSVKWHVYTESHLVPVPGKSYSDYFPLPLPSIGPANPGDAQFDSGLQPSEKFPKWTGILLNP